MVKSWTFKLLSTVRLFDMFTSVDAFISTVGAVISSSTSASISSCPSVEEYIFNEITQIYPDVNILTEETKRSFDPEKLYTFVLDPIDGTDVFSQGMPSWCISLGLLNKEFKPIAGIVYAPMWGSLFFSDIGKKATHNNKEIILSNKIDISSRKSNILVHSNIHRYICI